MYDVNEVFLTGRLTRNPELRKTPSGVSVCDLSLASNRYSGKDADGKARQFTTFTKVTLWDDKAEYFSERLHTGDLVMVRGRLVDDNFEKDMGNGQTLKTGGRLKIEVSRGHRVQLLSTAKGKEVHNADTIAAELDLE